MALRRGRRCPGGCLARPAAARFAAGFGGAGRGRHRPRPDVPGGADGGALRRDAAVPRRGVARVGAAAGQRPCAARTTSRRSISTSSTPWWRRPTRPGYRSRHRRSSASSPSSVAPSPCRPSWPTSVAGWCWTTTDRAAAAATALGRLAAARVDGADPEQWWIQRVLSDDRPLRRPEQQVRLSPSKVESFGDCRLRWALTSAGGDAPSQGSANLGTLIHDIAHELGDDADAETLVAEVERRWGRLGLPPGWATDRQREQAHRMAYRLAAYFADPDPSREGRLRGPAARRRRPGHHQRPRRPARASPTAACGSSTTRPAAASPRPTTSRPTRSSAPTSWPSSTARSAARARPRPAPRCCTSARPPAPRDKPAHPAAAAAGHPGRPRVGGRSWWRRRRRVWAAASSRRRPVRGARSARSRPRARPCRRGARCDDHPLRRRSGRGARACPRRPTSSAPSSRPTRCGRSSSWPVPAPARPRRWPRASSGWSPTATSSPTRCWASPSPARPPPSWPSGSAAGCAASPTRGSGRPSRSDEDGAEPLGGIPVVSTYHSYAGRLVREHALRLGYEPESRLLSEAAAWQYAYEVVSRYDGDVDELTSAESTVTEAVVSLAGEMAEHLLDPEDVSALHRRVRGGDAGGAQGGDQEAGAPDGDREGPAGAAQPAGDPADGARLPRPQARARRDGLRRPDGAGRAAGSVGSRASG